jgi:hypothetical protein
MKKMITLILLVIFTISQTYAWEGIADDGSQIEIESYDHQGQGEGDVEYYKDGEYHSGYLDMYVGGSGTITDEDGNTFEVDMD